MKSRLDLPVLALPLLAGTLAFLALPSSARPAANDPPVVTCSLPARSRAQVGGVLELSVEASDPNGDRVTLRLLEVPVGLAYAPLLDAASPATLDLRWRLDEEGPRQLVFEATDDGSRPLSTRLTVEVIVDGVSPVQSADVTGDGIPDLVVPARLADSDTVANAGAIYVWEGGTPLTATPRATLAVPAASAEDGLPSAAGVRLADVTGDGVADVIAASSLVHLGAFEDAGAVYVFEGGASLVGDVAPLATLQRTPPGPDRLGRHGLHTVDLNADGILDVVTCSGYARVASVDDAGAISVWFGGPTLTGTLAPGADLVMVDPQPNDWISGYLTPSVQFADVTGDGVRDVVSGSFTRTVAGKSNAGGLYVWAGGPGLAGVSTPTADLRQSNPATIDLMGLHGWELGDVTGDDVLDVVTTGEFESLAVFAGGSGLAGVVTPSASCVVPSGEIGLGRPGVRLVDLTDDGVADVVTGNQYADQPGASNAGAMYVWAGGPALTGNVDPTATFRNPNAEKYDYLGGKGRYALGDVAGNAALDLVAVSIGQGAEDYGEAYVWQGGALAGKVDPDATLGLGGGTFDDYLGASAVLLVELTGDEAFDVLLASGWNDNGGAKDAGALHLWAGGAALAGNPSVHATLRVPGPEDYDRLGATTLHTADLSGDGRVDVVAAAGTLAENGPPEGLVHVWRGGAGLSGTAAPDASLVFEWSGYAPKYPDKRRPLLLGDVTGDGVLDALSWDPQFDTPIALTVGAVLLWPGGARLTGTPASTKLFTPGAQGAHLGAIQPGVNLLPGLRLLDLTGDGTRELVGIARGAAPLGNIIPHTGMLSVWVGPIASVPVPDVNLFVPDAQPEDRLGL